MKELTEKILKSGIIDKHVATLMERWGAIDPGAADLVDERKKLTKGALIEMLEEIQEESELLKTDPIREVVLTPTKVSQRFVVLEKPDGQTIDPVANFASPTKCFFGQWSTDQGTEDDLAPFLIPGFKVKDSGKTFIILEVNKVQSAAEDPSWEVTLGDEEEY